MLFVELRFLPFFAAVLLVHWLLPWSRARKVWLLGTSYLFYAAWDWRFLGLIVLSTLVDYVVGLRVRRGGMLRRPWLLFSLAANLGILGFYKYLGFFVESGARLLEGLGFSASVPVLEIVLPVGISFYTFQTLSYSIDVARGTLKPTRDLLDLALFVGFFPQLVAGPIVRAGNFLPQLDGPRRWAEVAARPALLLFLVGFFKKACVSDNLSPYVDRFFADPSLFDGGSAWLAALAYSVQIYCDFSGYSDMAIACAALLGYHLPLNFDRPYLAANLTEFWRRWHITLSSWLRDYVYISLGGNRGTRWRTYANLMLTMLLGGLWHGAGWNFVLWGGLHGVGLALLRWGRNRGWSRLLPPIVGIAATFLFVTIAWVPFRAADGGAALEALRALMNLGNGTEELPVAIAGFLALLLVLHAPFMRSLSGRLLALPSWGFALVFGVLAALTLPWLSLQVQPFVYFQF